MATSHVLRIGFIEEPFFAITFFSVRQINGSPINYPTLPLPFFPFPCRKDSSVTSKQKRLQVEPQMSNNI